MAELYRERVEALRRNMEREGVDIYLIPTSDYHSSEYVGDYFKERAFLTGFTGSAGTAVVARDEAGLWTDGRYFIQAERQLAGSGVTLFPMGQPKVPTVAEYVKEKLPEGGCIGFDGRCIAASDARRFCEIERRPGYDGEGSVSAPVDRPAFHAEGAGVDSRGEICRGERGVETFPDPGCAAGDRGEKGGAPRQQPLRYRLDLKSPGK